MSKTIFTQNYDHMDILEAVFITGFRFTLFPVMVRVMFITGFHDLFIKEVDIALYS